MGRVASDEADRCSFWTSSASTSAPMMNGKVCLCNVTDYYLYGIAQPAKARCLVTCLVFRPRSCSSHDFPNRLSRPSKLTIHDENDQRPIFPLFNCTSLPLTSFLSLSRRWGFQIRSVQISSVRFSLGSLFSESRQTGFLLASYPKNIT